MRLTKQTGHAIRILVDCTRAANQLVKVADISQRLDLTKQNVFKIVHILSRAGFVAPVRGPSGGVRLAKPAETIRVGDVVRAIEVTRVQIDGECGLADAEPQDGTALNVMFDDALTAFISVLDQHTLADLAQSQRFDASGPAKPKAGDRPRSGAARAKKKPANAARHT